MKLFLNYLDICNILSCKRSKAYSLIKALNQELKDSGYIVYDGRVSTEYFCNRFQLRESQVEALLKNTKEAK